MHFFKMMVENINRTYLEVEKANFCLAWDSIPRYLCGIL